MNYVTLSVKAANQWPDSICAIELIRMEENIIVDSFSTYVQTLQTFDPFYTSIHGIEANDVQLAPTFESLIPILERWLQHQTVISYFAPYDHLCLQESFEACGKLMPLFTHKNLLSDMKAQWPTLSSYTLYDVHVKVQTKEALNDAERIVQIAQALENKEALTHLETVATKSLVQKTVVFTGALEQMTRSEAARKVMQAGGFFSNTMTKKVDVLVVSERSQQQYDGTQKQSSKWTKAIHLQQQGFPIQIISEKEFFTWL